MAHLWRSLILFEKGKILTWIALRNALGMAIPLAIGVAMGQPAGGLIAAIGALNVAYSDGSDPYFYRARRMLSASILVAVAVVIGGLEGGRVELLPLLTAAIAFVAGMMTAVSQTATDIGNITLVTFIVFSAHAMPPHSALQAGAAAFGGGLLQTALALAFWPVRGRTPERRVLSELYAALARAADSPIPATEAPPASQESTKAQTQLALLGGDRSLEAERYLGLLSQAERLRLELMILARSRVRLGREPGGQAGEAAVVRTLNVASRVLASVAQALASGQAAHANLQNFDALRAAGGSLESLAERAQRPELQALLRDACSQTEALAGQLRSAVELTAHLSPVGAVEFARQQAVQPWSLRLTGGFALLSANLNLRSAAFRHAVRLAVTVGIADVIARALGWQRSYWIPMTAAIVLRPDFTGTFSRGLLRLAGTLAGLAIATGLFHLLSPSPGVQVAFIFVLTLAMRSLGPANYGIFVTALSGLIVLLLALTGVSPAQAIVLRGVNTFAGGILALLAYGLWPTWERTVAGEMLARMLDGYRAYFNAVRDAYLDPSGEHRAELDRARLAARLGRSNAEASAARLRAEPGVPPRRRALTDRILADSHKFVHAVMSLEAGLASSHPVPARPPFRTFASDVDLTLERLSAKLRGAESSSDGLPDLRQDHVKLLHSGDPEVDRYKLVNLETDRITNSLNTLSEELQQWREIRQ